MAHDPAHDPAHDAALDAVACLRGRERQVEELSGGLTNVNVKVTTEDGSVVVRIAQAGSELLAIDRDAERRNSEAAAEAGVGAPVIEYVEDPRLLVVGFIEGHTFTDDDLRDGGHLTRVAAACRQLHEGPRFVNEFDMFEIQPRYLAIAHEHGFRLPDRYEEFADQAQQIKRALGTKPVATVPCNNDLLAGNFIDDGQKIWLIDYEYAGNNDPCFELGNLWSEANLADEQLDELMEAYDGELLRHRVARARLWGLMSKYGWTLWGSIQSSVSTIDFDFWEWAMEKYDRAVAEFDDPGFEKVLEQATRDD
ncbi:choline/ethanolamine kinase family protein [Marmoricola sp. URHB0036]|uniref:choline/ethanolamine kinase family protein n=1 Tax=Marmoricola sp. URHB0036 TaxID=1298863 RepID=UPI00056B32FE|nr:choline/ethanolamine kinase family protein [Marmoricola sp. URHB0036]